MSRFPLLSFSPEIFENRAPPIVIPLHLLLCTRKSLKHSAPFFFPPSPRPSFPALLGTAGEDHPLPPKDFIVFSNLKDDPPSSWTALSSSLMLFFLTIAGSLLPTPLNGLQAKGLSLSQAPLRVSDLGPTRQRYPQFFNVIPPQAPFPFDLFESLLPFELCPQVLSYFCYIFFQVGIRVHAAPPPWFAGIFLCAPFPTPLSQPHSSLLLIRLHQTHSWPPLRTFCEPARKIKLVPFSPLPLSPPRIWKNGELSRGIRDKDQTQTIASSQDFFLPNMTTNNIFLLPFLSFFSRHGRDSPLIFLTYRLRTHRAPESISDFLSISNRSPSPLPSVPPSSVSSAKNLSFLFSHKRSPFDLLLNHDMYPISTFRPSRPLLLFPLPPHTYSAPAK